MKRFIKLALAVLLVANLLVTDVTPIVANDYGTDQTYEETELETPVVELDLDADSANIPIEELGTTIVAAGTFWENWWNLNGMFAHEHIEGEGIPAHLEGVYSQLLPTSGFESINDIRNYLLQYYTETWVDLELFGEFSSFVEYDSILYIHTARAGFPRPDWETAIHILVEQDGMHAVVETTVLTGTSNPAVTPWETQYRFTFTNGRINSVEDLSMERPPDDFVRIIDIFECENLAEIIAEELNGVEVYDAIYVSILHDFEILSSSAPIQSLSGIENLINLRHLSFSYGHISDLNPLSSLTNLTHLSLIASNISDVSPLSNLSNLEELKLWSNNISDLTPLSNLSNLSQLDLAWNTISDLTPLSSLTNLTYLSLWDNHISDVNPLSSLTNLTSLRLGANNITDLTPLSDLNNLSQLALGDNHISDLTPLSSLINLTYLSLWDNHISDVNPLSNLTNLTYLSLPMNHISDVSPLSSLTNLEILGLNDNHVNDLTSLSSLTNLSWLNLWSNNIRNLTPLSSLTNLPWVGIGDNCVADFSPLDELVANGLYIAGMDEQDESCVIDPAHTECPPCQCQSRILPQAGAITTTTALLGVAAGIALVKIIATAIKNKEN